MKTKDEVKTDIIEYLHYRSHSGFLNNIRYRLKRETKEIFRLFELLELESDPKRFEELTNQIYMCMSLTWRDYKIYNSENSR